MIRKYIGGVDIHDGVITKYYVNIIEYIVYKRQLKHIKGVRNTIDFMFNWQNISKKVVIK